MESKDDTKKPFYQPKTLYAFTFNPDTKTFDGWKRGLSSVQQITKLRKFIDNVLSDYKYLLHFDISTPIEIYKDKIPRLHLHGVLFLESDMLVTKWLLETSPYMASKGYIKIGPITDQEVWYNYMSKYDDVLHISPIQQKIQYRINKFIISKPPAALEVNTPYTIYLSPIKRKNQIKKNSIETYLPPDPKSDPKPNQKAA